MLSRYVVSQVKHNSFFLAGLALGLWLALLGVPLEDAGPAQCAARDAAPGAAQDEFAPAHGERVAAAGRAGPLSRPRYYSTELGMRAPLLAAVLSDEAALDATGRGAALNATAAALQPALRFFIAAAGGGLPRAPLPNVVGFTDTREMLRPFHALKYLADNHLDEYDFFFLVSDATFVNAHRLAAVAQALSVSQDVYMGLPADDDSHYCTLEGGILLSNSVLRAVHAQLDWCVRNSYSAHHHENIGRCVLHAAHCACATRLQAVHYEALRDTPPAPPAGLPDAVTVFPVTEPRRFHQLHAYVSRVYLERGEREAAALRRALRASARRHPPGYRNASWPRGLRDDPGLAPPPPDTRWDHLRWTAFNTSHVFMPDERSAVGALSGRQAAAVRLAGAAACAWAERRWGAAARLQRGAWQWQPARALRYRLLLRLAGGAVRAVELARVLGAARLVPVPYVTESARVWLVLSVQPDSRAAAEGFLRRYEAACLARHANTALVIMMVYSDDSEQQAAEGAALQRAVAALSSKHGAGAHLLWGDARAQSRDTPPDRAALDAALLLLPRDALLLLITPHMDFNEDFLNRVRMNSIPGAQWYLPVPFSRFEQYSHPRFVDASGNKPQVNTGRFNAARRRVLGVHRQDYEAAAGGAQLSPAQLAPAQLLARSGLRVLRAPDPGLVGAARGAPCRLRAAAPDAACLRAQRADNFTQLDLGARHTLAKLLLELQAERAD